MANTNVKGSDEVIQANFFAPFGLPGVIAKVAKVVQKARKPKREPSQAQRDCYDMFVRDWDQWPSGHYQALGCSCGITVQANGTIYPEPCEDHPNLKGADFGEKPRHWQISGNIAKAKLARHKRASWAEMSPKQREVLNTLFIRWNRKSMGDPKEWKNKIFTLDTPFDCGCTFVAKPMKVKGVLFVVQSWTAWYAVKVGNCNKGPGLCRCSQFLTFPQNIKLGVEVNRELRHQAKADKINA